MSHKLCVQGWDQMEHSNVRPPIDYRMAHHTKSIDLIVINETWSYSKNSTYCFELDFIFIFMITHILQLYNFCLHFFKNHNSLLKIAFSLFWRIAWNKRLLCLQVRRIVAKSRHSTCTQCIQSSGQNPSETVYTVYGRGGEDAAHWRRSCAQRVPRQPLRRPL